MNFELKPYSSSQLKRVAGTCHWADGQLVMSFAIHGHSVFWPELSVEPERKDELWTTTCFEAFLQTSDSTYYEVNVSPSGDWQVYEFQSYRQRCESLPEIQKISVHQELGQIRFELSFANPPRIEKIGVTCVLKTDQIEYWALDHPGDQPDFHDSRSFLLGV